MLRSLILLFVVGIAGLVAVGFIFSILVPLAWWALKIALILLLGYVILKLARPDLADEVRSRIEGRR